MIRTKMHMLRRGLALLVVMALLALSLTLVACGSHSGSQQTGGSNISTGGTSQQETTPGGTNGGIQGADQQVQTAISGVDNAQNDVNNADAGSNNDNGQQP